MGARDKSARHQGGLAKHGKGDGPPAHQLHSDFDFGEVDFVKIDAEGFELFILRGGEQTLLRNRPLILMEEFAANARYGVEPGAAVRYLQSLGAVLIETLRDDNHLLGWPGA